MVSVFTLPTDASSLVPLRAGLASVTGLYHPVPSSKTLFALCDTQLAKHLKKEFLVRVSAAARGGKCLSVDST